MSNGISETSAIPDAFEIDLFLNKFEKKSKLFKNSCDKYLREEINIGDITRQLSEATADAELYFSENSLHMNLDQLTRYGMIQNVFEDLTGELFKIDIDRGHAVILEALRHGDYFIINLSYNSIKSSVYMLHANTKIKTEQNQQLLALDQKIEATQAMVKVLKALENVIKIEDLSLLDFDRIQKVIEIYRNYFGNTEQIRIKQASDERLFLLFREHIATLASLNFCHDQALRQIPHYCDWLDPLAVQSSHQQMLSDWRELAKAQLEYHPAANSSSRIADLKRQLQKKNVKATSFYAKYLDMALLEPEAEDDLGDWFNA